MSLDKVRRLLDTAEIQLDNEDWKEAYDTLCRANRAVDEVAIRTHHKIDPPDLSPIPGLTQLGDRGYE